MIATLKTPGAVNPALSEKYVERLAQQHFVSYREVYVEKKEGLEGAEVEESAGKAEL